MDDYQSMDASLGRHALDLAQQEWGGLRSINSALSGLVSEPDRTCTVGGHWYVVSIEHQQGELARGEIAARGMVAYLPMSSKSDRHGRGAYRIVSRPLFGLHMFVRCHPIQWGLARTARGVRRFLGANGKPEPVDDRQIEVVRLVEAEKREEALELAAAEQRMVKARAVGRSGMVWHFTEGDRVRIKTGPFAGFYAELRSSVDVHDRIRALVSLFGGSSQIELSAFDVEIAV